jgi:hypothetical protein
MREQAASRHDRQDEEDCKRPGHCSPVPFVRSKRETATHHKSSMLQGYLQEIRAPSLGLSTALGLEGVR